MRWSNKEWDGSIFLAGMVAAFILMIVLTYRNQDFAALETSQKILEIIKDMFIFMAGYLFKKAVDTLGGGGMGEGANA